VYTTVSITTTSKTLCGSFKCGSDLEKEDYLQIMGHPETKRLIAKMNGRFCFLYGGVWRVI
jgi:hypothetical protein